MAVVLAHPRNLLDKAKMGIILVNESLDNESREDAYR